MSTPSPADLHPPLGMRVVCGPVELRGITDELLVELGALAAEGIHDPAAMPFLHPWTDAPTAELPARLASYHWGLRAAFGPPAWALELAVLRDGEVVGVQGLHARDFAVTRSAATGSWLGRRHQGRGTGTLMRRAMCVLAFDHLGATEVTSGAFLDNPASLAVSRKVGYRPNGQRRVERRPGEVAIEQQLLLEPQDLVRPPRPGEVTGLAPVVDALGLVGLA